MKRGIVFLVLILFCFCGCQITEREIETKNCFNSSNNMLYIVIPEFFSDYIEKKAVEFKKHNSNFDFKFIRIKDDEGYRKYALDEILNRKANLFYVNGEKDCYFFKDLIGSFEVLKDDMDNVKYLGGFPTYSVSKHFFGIILNLKFLQLFGIEEENLYSLEGFFKCLSNIKKDKKGLNEENIVKIGADLSSLVFCFPFVEGEISNDFERILQFEIEEEGNLNNSLLDNKLMFFIGGSRFLDLDLFKNREEDIKFLPLFTKNNNCVIYEEDCFCFNKDNTNEQNKILSEFLSFVAKDKNNLKTDFLIKESEIKNMPPGFRENFKKELENLKSKKISFKGLKEMIKKHYDMAKTLD